MFVLTNTFQPAFMGISSFFFQWSAQITLDEGLVDKALEARRGGRLGEAADLMEEAFNKSPDLRDKYAHQVKLWRCGISM